MPGDPQECREHAKRCWQLASETNNLALRDSLTEIAQKWARLATELEATKTLLDEWGDPMPQGKNWIATLHSEGREMEARLAPRGTPWLQRGR
jgi:hypothetical protein